MNVVHVSNSDTNGGAAIAALRICKSQQLISDLSSRLLVQIKKSRETFVQSTQNNFLKKIQILNNFFLDQLSIRLFTIMSRGRFTFPYFGESVSDLELIKNADIINLHWVNSGFLSLNSLEKISELNKPIVWTLHDMWAFTGGCHYTSGCTKFIQNCFDCPSLIFKSNYDFSNKIFKRKQKLFSKLNLTIVTCSKWLAQESSKSKLLKDKNIRVIPNPIATEIYRPINREKARELLKLPINKKMILTGAMNLKDERKGFSFLIDALKIMNKLKLNIDIELIVFGKLDENTLSEIPFKVQQLGKLKTAEEIVLAYNSADVYVAPSLQDNLPNTVMEAMACGVPVVAFNVGGIPDMIEHQQNGILAKPMSSKELAEGIELILFNEELHKKFSVAAREKVLNNFRQDLVAKKYLEVYKSVLEG